MDHCWVTKEPDNRQVSGPFIFAHCSELSLPQRMAKGFIRGRQLRLGDEEPVFRVKRRIIGVCLILVLCIDGFPSVELGFQIAQVHVIKREKQRDGDGSAMSIDLLLNRVGLNRRSQSYARGDSRRSMRALRVEMPISSV
jgi:hypothetical protein